MLTTAWQIRWLLGMLALVAFNWPSALRADEARWELDGLQGRDVRALAVTSDSGGMAALTGRGHEATPLWLREGRGWSPAPGVPSFVLTLSPGPEGGLLLGTGRDIADQPGVFLLAARASSATRLYDAQAVGALALAPSQAGYDIYAGTAPWADRDAGPELLRMEASSGTWSSLLDGSLVCEHSRSYFKQIMVAPSQPSTVLALEWCFIMGLRDSRIWRSDDRGRSWRVLPRRGAAVSLISTVAVDPTDPSVLFLGGLDEASIPTPGVERSLDGGQSWEPKGEAVDGLTGIRALIVDPLNPRRVLAGTDRGECFVSEDRGESWQSMAAIEGLRIRSLVVDQSNRRLYAATNDGVWSIVLP